MSVALFTFTGGVGVDLGFIWGLPELEPDAVKWDTHLSCTVWETHLSWTEWRGDFELALLMIDYFISLCISSLWE